VRVGRFPSPNQDGSKLLATIKPRSSPTALSLLDIGSISNVVDQAKLVLTHGDKLPSNPEYTVDLENAFQPKLCRWKIHPLDG